MALRKDEVFNISVTELLLIVMFALLIVTILLNSQLMDENAELEKSISQFDKTAATLDEVAKKMGLDDSWKQNAGTELSTALAQLQGLVAALQKSVDSAGASSVLAKMTLDDVWTTLGRLTDENFNAAELLKAISELNEELTECLAKLETTTEEVEILQAQVAQLTEQKYQLSHALDEALYERDQAEQERLTKEQQIQNLIGQVENLSNGLELPPCWSTPDGKVQYTYLVEITDRDLLVSSIYPPERQQEYQSMMSQDYIQTSFSLDTFRQTFQIFYTVAKASIPECRFFVQISDETSPQAKQEYKNGSKAIESIFYKYLLD